MAHVAGGAFEGPTGNPETLNLGSDDGSQVELYGLAFSQSGIDLLDGLELGSMIVITDLRTAIDGVLAEGSPLTIVPGGRGNVIGRGTFTVTKLLLGDFNNDGSVDSADYVVWRNTAGLEVEPGSGADHDFDGRVTGRDREVWASRFGVTVDALLAAAASTAIPEPSAVWLAIVLAGSGAQIRRKRRR